MYVSSTAPIQSSTSPMPPERRNRYNARKQCVFVSVGRAASNYACSAPIGSFSEFGLNFQYQVKRANDLLNQLDTGVTMQRAQAGSTSTGTSGAPTVLPFNPVTTDPTPKPSVQQPGPWDSPQWGDYSSALLPICTPWQSLLDGLREHPGWAIGGVAAVLLAAGVIGVGEKRRRAA